MLHLQRKIITTTRTSVSTLSLVRQLTQVGEPLPTGATLIFSHHRSLSLSCFVGFEVVFCG